MAQVIISYEDKRGADCRDYPHTADETLKRVQSLARRRICADVTLDGKRIGQVFKTDECGGKPFWSWWLDWHEAQKVTAQTCHLCGAVVDGDALTVQTAADGTPKLGAFLCRAHLVAGTERLKAAIREQREGGE